MDRCPVCSADVDRDDPPAVSRYNGDIYTFCSEACQREFERQPEKYVRQAA